MDHTPFSKREASKPNSWTRWEMVNIRTQRIGIGIAAGIETFMVLANRGGLVILFGLPIADFAQRECFTDLKSGTYQH